MDFEVLRELITQIILDIVPKQDQKNRSLWIIEEMPKNWYVLDNASAMLSAEYAIDIIPVYYEGTECLQRLGDYGRVYNVEYLKENPLPYDLVILFNLSLKTLSKLANLCIDDDLLEFIFDCLREGVSIWMDSWANRQEYHGLSSSLWSSVLALVHKLQSFGIVEHHFDLEGLVESGQLVLENTGNTIISLEDLHQYEPQELLSVKGRERARLTPLAMDYIKEAEFRDKARMRWTDE